MGNTFFEFDMSHMLGKEDGILGDGFVNQRHAIIVTF